MIKLKALSELSAGHKKCKVRSHPRWSDISRIRELAEQYHIIYEDPKSVSVADSIMNAECIAGTYSTVLTEAYHSDCSIILDDMTDPEMYEYLNKAMFILCSKPHRRLSEMLLETRD